MPTRRLLLASAILLPTKAEGLMPLLGVGKSSGGGGMQAQFPNASNTGHTNAPGFTTLSPGGAVASGNTYNFLDYPTGLTLNALSNVTFNGCRFQSNATAFANVRVVGCNNITFNYCSVVPLVSLRPTPTHPGVWPSAGSGQPVHGNDDPAAAPYMIPFADSYQYGIRMENNSLGVTIDHCDIWGFGNSVDMSWVNNVTVRDSWIHDAANGNNGTIPDAYHHDGPGYLDGLGPPANVLVDHCTIASLGNTNAIAFQNATSPYNSLIVRNSYITGFGTCIDMGHNVSGNTNLSFTNNIIGTDIRWLFSMLYADFSAQFGAASNLWRGNTFHVREGTSRQPGSNPAWTVADHGKFVHPNNSLQSTDFE